MEKQGNPMMRDEVAASSFACAEHKVRALSSERDTNILLFTSTTSARGETVADNNTDTAKHESSNDLNPKESSVNEKHDDDNDDEASTGEHDKKWEHCYDDDDDADDCIFGVDFDNNNDDFLDQILEENCRSIQDELQRQLDEQIEQALQEQLDQQLNDYFQQNHHALDSYWATKSQLYDDEYHEEDSFPYDDDDNDNEVYQADTTDFMGCKLLSQQFADGLHLNDNHATPTVHDINASIQKAIDYYRATEIAKKSKG